MIQTKVCTLPIDSKADGGSLTYVLEGRPGGRGASVVLYSIKLLQCPDPANTRITATMFHGPDGEVYDLHSTPLNSATPTSPPSVLVGQADTSKVVDDWLQLRLAIQHAQGAAGSLVWALAEIYELRKPFQGDRVLASTCQPRLRAGRTEGLPVRGGV